VQGFISFVAPDVMETFCDDLPPLSEAVCLAEVKKDPAQCDLKLQKGSADLCKKYYLMDKCRDAGGSDEDRVVCIGQGAIEMGMDDVCDQLLITDIIYDCHAQVRKEKAYCRKIGDEELKAACLAKVGGGDIKPVGRTNFSAYRRWFPAGDDLTDCERFMTIVGLPVVYIENLGSRLICWYGTEWGNINSAQANISIKAYENLDAAKYAWDNEFSASADTGQAGTYLQLIQQDGSLSAVDSGEDWEYVRKSEYVNPPGWFYDVHCGKLYQNAVILFRHGYLENLKEDECGRINLEAMLLLDDKMK
jgi:hypothetical protein